MPRERGLTDAQWERIAVLMPSTDGMKSRPFRDQRQVIEGVIYRFRTGIAWMVSVDSTMLKPLLSQLAVKRLGPGRPRTRPDAVLGDMAYSSRGSRAMLPERKITAVIPQRSDQIAHRQRRGSAGGRPPAFNDHGQWRGIATRYDKLATNYRGGAGLRAITIWLAT